MLGQPIPYAQPLPREATELPPFPPERPRPGLGRGLFKGLFGRSRKEYLLTQQMYQVLGQRVKVATYTGELDGEIAGVYPDHLLVSKEEQKYYIRWDAIVYVAPVEEL